MLIPRRREPITRPDPIPTRYLIQRVADILVRFPHASFVETLNLDNKDEFAYNPETGLLTFTQAGRKGTVNLTSAYWWSVRERDAVIAESPYTPAAAESQESQR